MVFILFKTGNPYPLTVVSDPQKVHAKYEGFSRGFGDSIIPDNTTLAYERQMKPLCKWQNGEFAAEWDCNDSDEVYKLIAYKVE